VLSYRGTMAREAVIADPEQHTVMDPDGAVRSIQAASLDLPEEELEAIWSPMHLERLARTYWKYLSRVTLGLIRVVYGREERAVVFLTRPFVLLRFHAPEYEIGGGRGIVRWRIRDGILVAPAGRGRDGYLEIDVRREDSERPGYARVHVEVEVANFYPAIAMWIARWFYSQTQSRIHVLVTHGFLRSLAKLELEESVVGQLATMGPAVAEEPSTNGHRPRERDEVNVGDTPWLVVAALSAAAVGLALAIVLRGRGD
jgi:hypothetical protein